MQQKSGRPELLKYINQELIIREIVKTGEISRADLARATGLALPSIMRIVDALVAKGVVVEIGPGVSTGGRKPNLVTLNKDYKWIVGVEIASLTIVTLADFSGNVVEAVALDMRHESRPERTLEKIAELIEEMLKKHGVSKDNVAAIGVGTPGSGFKHQMHIEGFVAKGWESIEVSRELSRLTGMKVIEDNVCRTRTLSEIWFGRGRQQTDFIYAFIDWGVGIGIVNEGQIVSGSEGVAGEFGHTSIDRFGKQCYCGKKGCIEMYASVGALEEGAKNVWEEIPAEESLREPDKLEIKKEAADFAWIIEHKEQEAVKKLIIETADALAFAIANTINLLNPPMVILGGLVPRELPELVYEVKNRIGQYIFHNLSLNTPIYLSEVNNETVCLGSIALVIHHELMSRQ